MSEPVRIDNATGETPCLVRWMVETPVGWLGAWDREAFDAYTEPLRLRLAEAVALLREESYEQHRFTQMTEYPSVTRMLLWHMDRSRRIDAFLAADSATHRENDA